MSTNNQGLIKPSTYSHPSSFAKVEEASKFESKNVRKIAAFEPKRFDLHHSSSE